MLAWQLNTNVYKRFSTLKLTGSWTGFPGCGRQIIEAFQPVKTIELIVAGIFTHIKPFQLIEVGCFGADY